SFFLFPWKWLLRFEGEEEDEGVDNFKEILNSSMISTTDDFWFWKHDSSGLYSVKSAFLTLSSSTVDEDRLPTRYNLWKRVSLWMLVLLLV
ncbi:hypothetical protein L195_g048102, partial [Trifolium pratense]